jgi:hypothetical protein
MIIDIKHTKIMETTPNKKHDYFTNNNVMYEPPSTDRMWVNQKDDYKKIVVNKRGRQIKKRHYRERQLSPDPYMRNKNYNKIKPPWSFSWCKRCAYHSMIFNRTYQKKELKLQHDECRVDNL